MWCDPVDVSFIPSSQGFYHFYGPSSIKYSCGLEIYRYKDNDYYLFGKTKYLKTNEDNDCGIAE